jgi:hypothetical protein
MRKLLPSVFDENIDPDFSFAQAVEESIEDIKSGLADGMDPFAYEVFALGPEVTACLSIGSGEARAGGGGRLFSLLISSASWKCQRTA